MTTTEVPATPAAAAALKNPLILAGRAFVRHYRQHLDTGSRAQLRRAELPSTQAAFWACINAARRSADHIDDTRLKRLLEQLMKLQVFEDARDCDDYENVGSYMARHASRIKTRRAEVLLACDRREDAMEEVARLLTIGAGDIDYGVLISDLYYFGDEVRRRWAESYFD